MWLQDLNLHLWLPWYGDMVPKTKSTLHAVYKKQLSPEEECWRVFYNLGGFFGTIWFFWIIAFAQVLTDSYVITVRFSYYSDFFNLFYF